MSSIDFFNLPFMDWPSFFSFILRFALNFLFIWFIIHKLYYPKSHRRDYYFTFMLISISIFILIYLLADVKLKTGFVLGLFAIFGIIRYRTETMSVREMTYIFVIITISIINALAIKLSYGELLIANLIFIGAIYICESNKKLKHIEEKYVVYDKIELAKPEKMDELIADLKERLGLDIVKVEIGAIDFLKDSAMLKVFYNDPNDNDNSVNKVTKLPRVNK